MLRERFQALALIPDLELVDGIDHPVAGLGILLDDFKTGERGALVWSQILDSFQVPAVIKEPAEVHERQAAVFLEHPNGAELG